MEKEYKAQTLSEWTEGIYPNTKQCRFDCRECDVHGIVHVSDKEIEASGQLVFLVRLKELFEMVRAEGCKHV